jgi:cell division protein FtsB
MKNDLEYKLREALKKLEGLRALENTIAGLKADNKGLKNELNDTVLKLNRDISGLERQIQQLQNDNGALRS